MPGSNTATSLRHGIERIEGIDDEIDRVKDEISKLKEEISGLRNSRKTTLVLIQGETGFVPKVTEQIVRERKMDPMIRSAFQAQLELARATMGMLDGTPLGEAARRAYDPKPAPSDSRVEDKDQDALPGVEDPPKPAAGAAKEDLDAIWQEGVEAAKAGKRLDSNPYHESAQRAAYDEGWCHEKGSDGMDIPDALQPKKKKKDQDQGDDDQRKAA